jgi:hypothetical protein
MRWSLAIYPVNYPLFVCHASNEVAQIIQLGRWGKWKAAGSPPQVEN